MRRPKKHQAWAAASAATSSPNETPASSSAALVADARAAVRLVRSRFNKSGAGQFASRRNTCAPRTGASSRYSASAPLRRPEVSR